MKPFSLASCNSEMNRLEESVEYFEDGTEDHVPEE